MVLYFHSQGYSPASVGVILALNSVIPLLFAMPAGGFIDRIGTRKAVLIGSLLCTASGLLYVLGGAKGMLPFFLLGQFMNGVGALLCWGALQASAAIQANQWRALGKGDHILSNFAFVNSLAQLSGPVLGGIVSDKDGYVSVFMIYILLCLLALGNALLFPATAKSGGRAGEGAGAKPADLRFWNSYASGFSLMKSNRPFFIAMVLNGILFVLVDLRGTFLPVYFSTGGLSNTEVGGLLSISGLAAVMIRPFVGSLLKHIGHRWLIFICIVSGGVCLMGLSFYPPFWFMAVIIFLWGICTGVNQPIALIMVANTVRQQEQGMGMSIRTMANRGVQVVNPVVMGGLSGIFGLAVGFGIVGAVMLLAALTYIYRKNGSFSVDL